MFPSAGLFNNAPCPFFQHGLCHRPYCHFKHSPVEKKEISRKEKSTNSFLSESEEQQKEKRKKSVSFQDDEDEMMMKIVKNISPSKLMAYAQKRKEEKELKETLDQIERESEENLEKERHVLRNKLKKGELQGGLIDSFYNKNSTIGNIITPLDEHDETTSEINIDNKKTKEKKICQCDDPECSGFIESDSDNIELNNISQLHFDQMIAEPQEQSSDIKKRRRKKKRRKLDNNTDDANENNIFPLKKRSIIDSIANLEALVSKTKKSDKSDGNDSDCVTIDEHKTGNDKPVRTNQDQIIGDQHQSIFEIMDRETSKKVNLATKQNVANKDDNNKKVMTGHDSLKKRVAHSNEEVRRAKVQKKSHVTKLSYISPGLAAPGITAPVNKDNSQSKEISTESSSSSFDVSTDQGVYLGKKRLAHTLQKNKVDNRKSDNSKTAACGDSNKSIAARPKLPMEFNAKIPHLLRQRYLDKIIDEYLPKCASEAIAYKKALEDEAVANQRSLRKQIYLNICVNIIKRIRNLPSIVKNDTEDSDDVVEVSPFDTGKPTVSSIKQSEIARQTAMRLQNSTLAGYKKSVPKSRIKAPSSTLINAKSVTSSPSLPSKSNTITKRRLSAEAVDLTEENFYQHLVDKYLLNNNQMWENRYPTFDHEKQIVAVKDYQASKNPLKRICCRCGKDYFMNAKGKYITRDECHYHWGRLRKQRERGIFSSYFSCCRADPNEQPCCIARLHVCDKIGELTGFVSTENWFNENSQRKVLALDCEMCYTTQGLELTRLTVVDFNLAQMIDLYVKPKNPIVDYNTRFSGVSKENLKDTTTTIDDIHDILSNIIDAKTILIGHSLESDLNALKIVHRTVVDTALVFPHRLGLPFKRALRTLMGEYMQKIIQNEESGHDSCEDARSCMELMRYKFKEDMKKVSRAHQLSTGMALKSFYSTKQLS